MSSNPTMWGVHMPESLGDAPLEKGFIAIGWKEVGDLSRLPADREPIKAALRAARPEAKPGAIAPWAGVLYRFVHELKFGDAVLYPSKMDRMINLGLIDGPYAYEPSTGQYPNRRPVRWKAQLPRSGFSQSALYEIGSAITLFQVSTHADEFWAAMEGKQLASEDEDEETVEAVSAQVEESTEDFIIKRLMGSQSAYEFEGFVAHLLTCIGYHARVTKASGDGGVDVIAHRDELGFEPPIIKVQCKQTVSKIGRPAVQQLHGAIENGEHGLFVTLGGFTPDAEVFERGKPNLRLIGGPQLIELIYRHYHKFEQRYQRLIPLKRAYLPGSTSGLSAEDA